ncbi:MAG: polyprenyl synthetase family protein [Planctomycetota bacterium]
MRDQHAEAGGSTRTKIEPGPLLAEPVEVMGVSADEAFSAWCEQVAMRTDDRMRRVLGARWMPAKLHDAMSYALFGGGKRVRPLLVSACFEGVGGNGDTHLDAAASVEMIHAFSLVHDDLPALDDDDLRRGRPTAHVAFGEAMAILAGDGLMSLAFEALAEVGDPVLAGKLVRELSRGTTSMIGGQVLDTLGGFGEIDDERQRVQLIHENKTGALILASCRMGAIAGGADEERIDLCTTFGTSIGLMFQIVDDLLDVEQSSEHLGKRTGKDADAGKRTWPGVLGVERARGEVERLHRQASDVCDRLGPASVHMRTLNDKLAIRTK